MRIKTNYNAFMSLAWLTVIPVKTMTSVANEWSLRTELVVKQARGGQ